VSRQGLFASGGAYKEGQRVESLTATRRTWTRATRLSRHVRATPLEKVLAAAKAHHQRLVAGSERLAARDSNDTQKSAWTAGQPVWHALEGNAYAGRRPVRRPHLASVSPLICA
jgi:hypothetical protein